MTERLLQFIWQLQYFNKIDLRTLDGEILQVINVGLYNHNQGPDFLNARIRIDGTILAGNIELHLDEGAWYRHEHHADANYKNIILHVLWEPPRHQRLPLPTLVLRDRVSGILLQRYRDLMKSKAFVPCANNVHDATGITWLGWKDRLVAERLLRKSMVVQQHLHQCHHHWEEVFWWMLARNFGIPINADAFEALARSIPLNIIARHKNHLPHLEALLLGQAGLLGNRAGAGTDVLKTNSLAFIERAALLNEETRVLNEEARVLNEDSEVLDDTNEVTDKDAAGLNDRRTNLGSTDTYPEILLREYQFFQRKYSLAPIHLPVHFLRMRPHNFPTVRLAQLAMLLHTISFPFSTVRECTTLRELRTLLQVAASDFWDTHYVLHESTAFRKKGLGQQMVDNIIINTIAPMLFAYGQLRQEQHYKDKAIDCLSQLPPEKNTITAQWESIGILNENASDSQALLELKKEYCDQRRCLECAVGNQLLGTNSHTVL